MHNMSINEVIVTLEAITGHKCSRSARGYMGRCPVHADRTPSLGIMEKNGRVLLTCFAGCSRRDIWEAINDKSCRYNPHEIPYDSSSLPPWERKIEKIYNYQSATGVVVLQKIRFEGKSFMIRRPNGKWGIGNEKPLLYQLPKVIQAGVVCIVEGEKDADSLTSRGLVATCSILGAASAGSAKWDTGFNDVFVGKTVLVFSDNDAPGIRHADFVYEQINAKRKFKVYPLPGLSRKMDITDWLDLGYTFDDLRRFFPEIGDFI